MSGLSIIGVCIRFEHLQRGRAYIPDRLGHRPTPFFFTNDLQNLGLPKCLTPILGLHYHAFRVGSPQHTSIVFIRDFNTACVQRKEIRSQMQLCDFTHQSLDSVTASIVLEQHRGSLWCTMDKLHFSAFVSMLG